MDMDNMLDSGLNGLYTIFHNIRSSNSAISADSLRNPKSYYSMNSKKIQWGFFVFLWIIFPFLEFGYISLGLPILSEEVSIPVSEISHYSYPKVGDTITDGVLWAIFTASGLLIHVCLRLSTPDWIQKHYFFNRYHL